MVMANLRSGFRLSFLAALIVFTGLALASYPMPGTELIWDKAGHLLAFLVLAFLLDHAWRGFWSKWIGLVLFGLGIEIAQWWSGYRHFELQDLAADTLGVAVYLLIQPQLRKIAVLRSLNQLD